MVALSIFVVVLAGAVVALASGRFGADLSIGMPPPAGTVGHDPLPVGAIDAADVRAVRLDRALRGYRMDQVDNLLDRFAEALAERDERIAALAQAEGGAGWEAPVAEPSAAEVSVYEVSAYEPPRAAAASAEAPEEAAPVDAPEGVAAGEGVATAEVGEAAQRGSGTEPIVANEPTDGAPKGS